MSLRYNHRILDVTFSMAPRSTQHMQRSTISFRVLPFQAGTVQVIPIIDGELLTVIVQRFRSYDRNQPSNDEYAGLISEYFKFGVARKHFYGRRGAYMIAGCVPLLGCSCGEWGCNPVMARIEVLSAHVVWNSFNGGNPTSASEFGGLHFEFERRAYEAAVVGVSPIWDAFQLQ
jgi:hypothetical protein